jgi:hypothetical protein
VNGRFRLPKAAARLNVMRLCPLLLLAIVTCGPASAQAQQLSSSAPPSETAASPVQDAVPSNLPVSLGRIRALLEQQPTRPLFNLHSVDQPTFRIEVKERSRLQEMVASLDFKSGPTPAGGLYTSEQQRVMFPSTNNPLVQPYGAFSQSELLTVLVENLAGKYLVGKAFSAITRADRARAEAAARDEVRHAIADYCVAQPNGGAGIAICSNPIQ